MNQSFLLKQDNFFILVESTLTGMVMVDREGIILYANPAAEQLFCMNRESLIGTTFGFPLLTEKTEEILIPRNRTIATVEMQVTQMLWENKTAYLVSLHDITTRKQTESALNNNEKMQRLALDAAKAGTWEWDLQTNVNTWSKELWKLYMLKEGSLSPTYANWIDSIHPEDRARCEFYFQKALQNHSEMNFEWRVNNSDKSERWLMSRGSPQIDEDGMVRYYRGVVIDITDRKKLETQLKYSNEMLQSVLDTIPHYICWKDRESRFLGCNKIYSEMVGLEEPQAIIGMTDLDMPWTLEQTDHFLACDRRIMDSDTAEYHLIESAVNAYGELRWLDTSKIPLHDAEEQVRGVLVAFEDITERKRSQAKLLEAIEKAEASNKAKSEFLANMSHEIRTPLNGIGGMLQLLQLTELNKEQVDYILNAIKSTNRLTRLLSDILDVSRMEAGKVSIVDEEFSIKCLEDSVLELFTTTAKEKSLEFTFNLDAMIPRKLRGDESRVQQILFNLVGNSIKFTETGSIRVQAKRLTTNKSSNCKVLFTVSDTGVGISDQQLKTIFDPFVQGEGSYTRRYQGAGLGRSIARK